MHRMAKGAIRIGIGVAVIALVVIVGVGVWHSELVVRQEVEDKALALAQTNVKDVNLWLHGKADLVESIADYIEHHPDYRAGVRDLFDVLGRADGDNTRVALWINSREVISQEGWAPPGVFDPTARPWFQTALGADEVAFSPVFEDARTRRPSFAVVKHVHLPNAVQPAIVLLIVDLKSLTYLLEGIKYGKTGQAFITDSESRVLSTSQGGLLFTRLDVHGDDGFAKLGRELRKGLTGFTYYNGRGTSKLAAYTKVPVTGWMFGITMPTAEAMGPVKVLGRNTTVLILGLLLVFGLTIFVVVRGLSGSISRIERAVKGSQIVQLEDEGQPADRWGQLAETVSQAVANLESFPDVLSRILGLKDAYTAKHSRMVTQLAVDIGRELGLSQREIRELACAAVLHDIGKVAVPDAVLGKPGQLTPAEFELIKSHPVLGAQVAEEANFAPPIVEAIRSHHERFDGHGYPNGLAGERIPLYARIIAVADTYDAMHSHRPYRLARPSDEVLAEMTAWVGTQFDPRVFQAFVDVLPRQPWVAAAPPSPSGEVAAELS